MAPKEAAAKTQMVMADYTQSLFNSPESSDCIIKHSCPKDCSCAEGRVVEPFFHAHKLILSRNPFFKKMFKSDFKEAREGVVDLGDNHYYQVKILLQHLYGFRWPYDYYDGPDDNNVACISIGHVIQLYSFAEKYLILQLQEELVRVVKERNRYPFNEMSVEHFGTIVGLVYEATPASDRGLRDIYVACAARHLATLYSPEQTHVIARLAKQCPEFLQDVADKVSGDRKISTDALGSSRVSGATEELCTQYNNFLAELRLRLQQGQR